MPFVRLSFGPLTSPILPPHKASPRSATRNPCTLIGGSRISGRTAAAGEVTTGILCPSLTQRFPAIPKVTSGSVTLDEMIDDILMYLMPNSDTSACRLSLEMTHSACSSPSPHLDLDTRRIHDAPKDEGSSPEIPSRARTPLCERHLLQRARRRSSLLRPAQPDVLVDDIRATFALLRRSNQTTLRVTSSTRHGGDQAQDLTRVVLCSVVGAYPPGTGACVRAVFDTLDQPGRAVH